MVGGLSFDPSGLPGSTGGIAPTRKETLESAFPGLTVLGQTVEDKAAAKATETPLERTAGKTTDPAAAPLPGQPKPLASGDTLLTAQQQGQPQTGADGKSTTPGELSDADKETIGKLRQRDAQVRAHERAHAAVGGQYAGAPSYSYQRGPDGQLYAVGGEVSIDIGAESDPQATLQKAAQVAAAALAPADPSGQDRAVAAAAQQLRLQALAQIREEKRAEAEQKQAESDADRAAAAEQQQAAGGGAAAPASAAAGALPAEKPAPTVPGQGAQSGDEATAGRGAARQATDAYRRQSETAPVANDNAAASAGANRRIGQLIGLIA